MTLNFQAFVNVWNFGCILLFSLLLWGQPISRLLTLMENILPWDFRGNRKEFYPLDNTKLFPFKLYNMLSGTDSKSEINPMKSDETAV